MMMRMMWWDDDLYTVNRNTKRESFFIKKYICIYIYIFRKEASHRLTKLLWFFSVLLNLKKSMLKIYEVSLTPRIRLSLSFFLSFLLVHYQNISWFFLIVYRYYSLQKSHHHQYTDAIKKYENVKHNQKNITIN